MKNRKRMIVTIIGSAFAVIVAITWWFDQKDIEYPVGAPKEKQVVRLALAKALITAPIFIALENKYFEEEGLEIVITNVYSSGKESFEAMLAGKADISTPATTPVVFNSFSRNDYAIFVTYTTTYEGIKIIARNDTGILEAADLKNRKIGIARGTISQLLMDMFLTYNKIATDEVTYLEYKGIELPDALMKGDVEVIAVWEPYADKALTLLGDKGFKIPSSRVYRIAINLATMNDFALSNQPVLEKLIRALIKSTRFIDAEKRESIRILSKHLEMEEELITQGIDDINFKVSLDQLLLLTMENEANWASQHKLKKPVKLPNYLNYINFKALEAVDPDLVTIIRNRNEN